jgi:predicted nuclease with TOPRIM domain
MNAEYQRLEAEASEVQQQINELVSSRNQMAAADFQKFETEMARLHHRLAGLRKGIGC